MPSPSQLFPWGFLGKEADTRPGEGEADSASLEFEVWVAEMFPDFFAFGFVLPVQVAIFGPSHRQASESYEQLQNQVR